MSLEVYLLRHAESMNNVRDPSLHVPDPPLTELGLWQARRLAPVVAAWDPHAVLCSPLLRSLQTAAPIVAAAGVPWHCWADVVEANRAHPPDGQPLSVLRERFPTVLFEEPLPWPGYPGLETPEEIALRAERLLSRVLTTFPDGTRLAVVGHGRFNAYLLRSALRAPQDGRVEIVQGNTCINHLHLGPESVALLRYNDCAHLA